MSSYYHSSYYNTRPSIHELEEVTIEGGLHPKQRKLPKLTNAGPQDPALIASWEKVQHLSEIYKQRLSERTLSLMGDIALHAYDVDTSLDDPFASYPRYYDLEH